MSRALRKIDPTRYKRLLSQTMPVVIETEEENERMLAIAERLMEKGENLSPEEEKLLKLLAKRIEDFEQRYYRPEEATPGSLTIFDGVSRSKAKPTLEVVWFQRNCL